MDQKELISFAAIGIDRMIAELETKRAEIRRTQDAPVIKRKRGRPPEGLLAAVNGAPVRSGWDNMTPEERSAEMKRRQAVTKAKAQVDARKKGARIRWERATPGEREKWLKGMQAGMRKKRREKQSQQAVERAKRAVERNQQPVVKIEATA